MIFVRFVTLVARIWVMFLEIAGWLLLSGRVWEFPLGLLLLSVLCLLFWLKTNCKSSVSHRFGIPWKVVFPFTCWNIWLLRNRTLFQRDSNRSRDLDATIKSSIAQAIEWKHFAIPISPPRSGRTILVKWCPPHTSYFKLNTDGACKTNLSQATGGGLISDSYGTWVIGFHRSLRPMHSLEAELWAVRDGLQLAMNNQFAPICVEMDALAAIQLIMGPTQPLHSMSNSIHECRYLMRQLGVERIDHVYGEGNKCAELLANMDFNDGLDFHIFDVAPDCITSHLCDDRNGVEYPRLLYGS